MVPWPKPVFCRFYFSFGHTKEDFSVGQVCRNCFKTIHRTTECSEGWKCHICGSEEHLAKKFPTVVHSVEVILTRGGSANGTGQDNATLQEKASYAEVVERSLSLLLQEMS